MTDTELVLTEVEGEPRIRDVDLGVRLGFERPGDIRKLIERHRENLNKISILATVAQTHEGAGRPSKAFYLNKKQAIFIAAKSETAAATDITIEIIEQFDAYERGVVPAPAPALAPMTDDEVIARSFLVARKRVEALEAAEAEGKRLREALAEARRPFWRHRIGS